MDKHFDRFGPFFLYQHRLHQVEFNEFDAGTFTIAIAAYRDGDTLRPGERNASAIIVAFNDEGGDIHLVFDRHLARTIELGGPNDTLVREFNRILSMSWSEFRHLCMNHPFARPSFARKAFWEEATEGNAVPTSQRALAFE